MDCTIPSLQQVAQDKSPPRVTMHLKKGPGKPWAQCIDDGWRLCKSAPSLPLDRSGRFAGEVQHHAVDTADLVGDAGADAFEEFVGNLHPVGGHAVL